MIRIIDCIDEIVDKCFGDPELKELLEFSINTTKITIKDQFLHHYEKACYLGTKEALMRSIMYRTHLQQDLLLRLQDYKKNLSRILELGEYSKVKLSYKDELTTETTIGASGSKTENNSTQVDNYSGADINTNVGINDNRTATSNTNDLKELKDIIPQPRIEGENQPLKIKRFQLEDGNLTETEESFYQKPKLADPQHNEAEGEIGYQNLTKDLSTNQNSDTNISSSSRGGKSSNKSNTKSANTHIKGSTADTTDRAVEFITNDARVKLWTKELPRLKTKFWNGFFSLFLYEHSY